MPSPAQLKQFLKDLNLAQARHGIRVATRGSHLVVLPIHEQPTDDNTVVIRPHDDVSVIEEVDATLIVA